MGRPKPGSVPAPDADWQGELVRLFPQAKLNEPMRLHTTFRIGGPAQAYVELAGTSEVAALYRFAQDRELPIFILGWGSNLLVQDGGVLGIVLRLRGDFEAIRFEGRRVLVGAGVRLPTLVAACAERGLTGPEPLVGVPGTLGGALVMNAGTREGEVGGLVRAVEALDPDRLRPQRLDREFLEFRYRASNLEGHMILSGELELKEGSKVDILKRIRELQRRRLQTQPIHTYNVGSTFKNPPGRFVAQLIEEAGLKGTRCGGIVVSQKHANFFENDRNGTARDVLGLADLVRRKILERFGVALDLEMKVVGEP